MGSWHSTCALTHLPIERGMKVRGFILLPHDFDYPQITKPVQNTPMVGGGMTSAYNAFCPLTYSFKGIYNDYGSVEKIKSSPHTKAILEYFNKLISTKKIVLNDNDTDKPFKKVTSFERLIKNIERINRFDMGPPLGLMLVLDSAFETVIKLLAGTKDTYEMKKWSRTVLMENAKLYSTNLIKKEALWKEPVRDYAKIAELEGGDECFNLMTSCLNSDASVKLLNRSFVREHLNKLITNPTEEFYNDLIDHVLFGEAMDRLRRTWVVQCGMGSQDTDYYLHRQLAEHVISLVARKKKEHEEDIDMTIEEEREHCDSIY